jgi:DoxX-like family
MASASPTEQTSKSALWTGRVFSALVVLFLVFDGVSHIVKPVSVVEAFVRIGYPLSLAVKLGTVELACVAVYAIPRSSVLGALLLTGYLGGAVATQVRAGSPFFGESLFPVYLGLVMWGGLLLREPRLRAMLPLKRSG